MQLKITNSLTKQKEEFEPINRENVRLYVCGPTVYDVPHLGNSRAVVVYDLLYRLLMHKYGEKSVTYVRNITDVDDKIIEAAKKNGVSAKELSEKVTKKFHEICKNLNCLTPTHEPKATDHIEEMLDLIGKLIKNGAAYEKNGHVYFRVNSFEDYGKLSGRKLEDLIAGARVEISQNKEHEGDFVLWKPAEDDFCVFDSPFGKGRPGWHIECSAMSWKFLGENFDIHGGGADLMFPHHTNEIAQSCMAHQGSKFANYWVHNGFLTVEGEKMSKSLGNFITPTELMQKGVPGELIRFCLMQTHYRKPFDWSESLLENAKKTLLKFYEATENVANSVSDADFEKFLEPLFNDMNVAVFMANLHDAVKSNPAMLKKACEFVGLLQMKDWREKLQTFNAKISEEEILYLIEQRKLAKLKKDWSKADEIRDHLKENGVILKDGAHGTDWEFY